MNNNDQQLVDYLYNQMIFQEFRCNHFISNKQLPSNSIWNKHIDENKILSSMIEKYKKFYIDKVELLKIKLDEIKQVNVNSYLTYDTEYYITQYIQRIEEINKYITILNAKDFDSIKNDKLSNISDAIDLQFPDYLVNPTLLGKLY